MDSAAWTAPDAHHDATGDGAGTERALHAREGERVAHGPREDHRRQDRVVGERREEVDARVDPEERQQAAPLTDVLEARAQFLAEARRPRALRRRGLEWPRDPYRHERGDGHQERHEIDHEHTGDPERHAGHAGQERRHGVGAERRDRAQTGRARVVAARQQHRDGGGVGGALKRPAGAGDRLGDVEVPDLEASAGVQVQHAERHHRRARIREQHDAAAVVSIDPHAGQRCERDHRNEPEEAEQRHRRRAPGALVDPDEQRERRHRGADLRHELAGPDDEKRAHGSPYYTKDARWGTFGAIER